MKLKIDFEHLKEKRWLKDLLVAFPLFALSLGILLYYIIGPSEGFFHSDCADSILWANATLESGKILSEDFYYAALLPFGSGIWMVPAVAVFGLSMQAQIFSMCVFAVLFCAVLTFFFRSMKWDWKWTAAAVFSVSLVLSGSEKLREIMWEHTIYYSLGIILVFLMLGLLFRILNSSCEKGRNAKFIVWSVLLFAVCVGCGTDGFQILMLTAVPVLGALVLYAFFDEETPLFSMRNGKKYVAALIMLVGVLAGFVLLSVLTKGGSISAGYENAYSLWSDLSVWRENAAKFFEQYFSLLGIDVTASKLFAWSSVVTILRLVGALAMLVCPIILLFRYHKIRDPYTKIALLAHWILTAVILFGYICGMLSAAEWRLTPLVGSAAVATFLCIRHFVLENGIVGKRIGILFLVVILAFSFVNFVTIAKIPADYGRDDPIYEVIEELEERGLDYGYASFWNAGRTTLLSDGNILVRNINIDASGITPNRYQSAESWYEDIEGQESYFLLLTSDEYTTFMSSLYGRKLIAYRGLLSEFNIDGYYVLEFGGNIFLD